MGDENEPLNGFTWQSGQERVTKGIVMWSDVFLHTDESTGDKLAILLMDTQGLFDNKTVDAESSRIFALGTLTSSLQIMNLTHRIQENDLQYLQFATEFAAYTASHQRGHSSQPFQKLLFLIRYVK